MSGRQKTVLVLLVLLILCVLAALAFVVGFPLLQQQSEQVQSGQADVHPSVAITSPQAGEQLPPDEPVMVHAVGRGSQIVRVELWIDDALHTAQNSSLPGGASPLPLVTFWQPGSGGTHTLIARAFDASGERAEALIEVEATAGEDRDADGVPDDADACPDEPGMPSAAGCPDRDGDGVGDAGDLCPDEPGAGTDGCPAPSDGDRDGDGVPDDEDPCPDEPGVPGHGCPLVGDRDGDGVPDDEDDCPDEPGVPAAGGCPDRDGDTVPDGTDACPDDPGPPESGCPAPVEGDRDGDGFPDDEDMCPDEPGVPATWGCPDRDGDGVRDSEDECPDEPGPPENRGCPVEGGGDGPGGDGDVDSDGDGIPDAEDACPEEPGLPEHDGCPEGADEGGADRDGDGVPDDADPCPDEPGEPEHDGCPPPDADEEEGMSPGPGEVEWPGDRMPTLIEFQALSFQVSDDYDGVYCYPSLAGAPAERYSFAPLDARQWDIAGELGSRSLLTTLEQPIEVQMACGGDVVHLGPGGGWGTYWSMGSISESHPPSDWDGHVITMRSGGGDEGRWFEAQYRLCSGSCDEAAFPAPLLLLSHGRDDLLIWQWNGAMDRLASYDVYMDGSRIARLRGTDPVGQFDVSRYAPLCGMRPTFHVTAVGRDGRESPSSNTVTWEAGPCPRVVRVTFDRLLTYDSGDGEHSCLGPIFGSFYVAGSDFESLRFEGDDYPDGYRLCPHSRYNIQEMFDTIWTWGSGMGSSPYDAPASSSVTMELGPDDEFTIGGVIYEWDRQGTSPIYREAFNHWRTTPAGAVRPGRYALRDGQIRLEFVIDVLVGPEVGPDPDLTITNVDVHEPSGQLRVHVFNNASDMPEPADITVHWVRVGSSEIVGTHTWEDVQIPSGGSRILQTSESVGPIGGMLFVLDPDEAVPDGNRGNNTFETPLTMRVEFLDAWAPHCSESGCSIFDCDSEWVFKVWAGYGPSESDISWVAYHERFPSSGDLVACAHSACMGHDSPDADWIMEGNERYTFDFDMPAAENLYVLVTGKEVDFWTSDDSFASPIYQYTPRDDWGASPDRHTGYLTAERSCNDAACSECGAESVRVRWRISHVR